MPPNTIILPTTSTHITPDPVSSLLGSSLLAPGLSLLFQHACVNVSSQVSLLILTTCYVTGAKFSTHDSPSRQSTAHSLTLQMSPQGGGFKIAPAHNTIWPENLTGIKFDEIASKLHNKNMTDFNLTKCAVRSIRKIQGKINIDGY